MKKPKLWVIGDSFSQPRNEYDGQPLIWTELVAAELGCDLVNNSYYGVSQDYCWLHLQVWIHERRISPEDYILVVMTHPNRFWYVEDQPDLSNGLWTIDLDQHVTREQEQAIRGFVQHIQRPELDTLHLISRMGWLAWAIESQGLRRPLMIKGFAFDLLHSENYRPLNFAQGHLYEIQSQEFRLEDGGVEAGTKYFSGADPRYNHLCLMNHPILAKGAAEALRNDSQLDLRSLEFHRHILPQGGIDNDPEFATAQLNPDLYQHYQQARKRINGLTSWLKNVKVK